MHDHARLCAADPRIQEYTAYCAYLRDVLERLIASVETEQRMRDSPLASLFDPGWAVDAAKEALAMETGRIAAEELRLMEELNAVGYTLADYVYAQIYGVPRSPSGLVPTRAEVVDALAQMEDLTKQSWALHGLLVPPEEEERGHEHRNL